MTKIILTVGILIIICSCKPEKINKQEEKTNLYNFTIQLVVKEKKNLDSLFNSIKSSVKDSVYFYELNDTRKIRIGFFENSFIAGQKAFSLFNVNIIKKYEIIDISNQKPVRDNFRKIYFAAIENERRSLFEYDLLLQENNLIWNKWGNDVIKLQRSSDNSIINFSTSLSFGRRAGFPYVLDVKLYSFKNSNVKLLKRYGDGLQTYSFWESDSVFHNYYTYLDTLNSSSVLKQRNIFNSNMELTADTTEKFDLLEDGFPLVIKKPFELVSKNRNYKIDAVAKNNIIDYSIIDIRDNIPIPIAKDSLKLMNVEWISQNNFCVISFTYYHTEDSSSKLFIVNLEEKKVQNIFTQGLSADFILHGNLVIFDEWIDDKKIIIFDYVKNAVIDMIETKYGCGINRI